MKTYQSMDLCELGGYVSDYHKEIHGFRPRGEGLYASREALVDLAESLDRYMAARRETFAGRETMRAEGWLVLETDPELIQQSIWLAEERDRQRREADSDWWTEAQAEAPMLRNQYGMAD